MLKQNAQIGGKTLKKSGKILMKLLLATVCVGKMYNKISQQGTAIPTTMRTEANVVRLRMPV